jgi:hypothetical protein
MSSLTVFIFPRNFFFTKSRKSESKECDITEKNTHVIFWERMSWVTNICSAFGVFRQSNEKTITKRHYYYRLRSKISIEFNAFEQKILFNEAMESHGTKNRINVYERETERFWERNKIRFFFWKDSHREIFGLIQEFYLFFIFILFF